MGDGFQILLHLLGAVALLLWGVRMVRTGVSRALGGKLHAVIQKMAGNRFSAILTGAGLAAALQSSTAVITMVSGFAGRGMIARVPALAMVLGADIGTALAVQLLSLDIRQAAPALIFLGVVLFLSTNGKRSRNIGRIMIGLALILFALGMISAVSEDLRQSTVIATILSALSGDPALAIIVTVLLTWLSYSSLAVILLTGQLAAQGLIDFPLAISMVVGANIGAAFPAFTATLAEPAAGKRPVIANMFFRVIGAVIFVLLYRSLPPDAAWRQQLNLLPPALLVGNAHLAFNLLVGLLFLPLLGPASRLMERIKPDEVLPGQENRRPQFLSPRDTADPVRGLANAAREVLRMADFTYEMLEMSLQAFRDKSVIARIRQLDDTIDSLHREATLYIAEITKGALNKRDSRRAMEIFAFATNLEHIGDIIDHSLVDLARVKHKSGIVLSDAGDREIAELHKELLENFQLAVNLFISGDFELAEQLIEEKHRYRDKIQDAIERHMDRLRQDIPESKGSSQLHLDILRDFRRISSHIAAIAYPIIEEEKAA